MLRTLRAYQALRMVTETRWVFSFVEDLRWVKDNDPLRTPSEGRPDTLEVDLAELAWRRGPAILEATDPRVLFQEQEILACAHLRRPALRAPEAAVAVATEAAVEVQPFAGSWRPLDATSRTCLTEGFSRSEQLGVGIVLVGEFMGWNFTIAKGGSLGSIIACWVIGIKKLLKFWLMWAISISARPITARRALSFALPG